MATKGGREGGEGGGELKGGEMEGGNEKKFKKEGRQCICNANPFQGA